tara:strand:+ start:31271 stop:31429 length:159 start_codon:yes stop_codon:yes gene_type:complete
MARYDISSVMKAGIAIPGASQLGGPSGGSMIREPTIGLPIKQRQSNRDKEKA